MNISDGFLAITTTSSGAPSGPSMSDIKSMISEIAQKITDDGVSHGVHSLNNMNKSITEGELSQYCILRN